MKMMTKLLLLLLLILTRINRSEEETVLKDATTVDICLKENYYGIDLIQGAFRCQAACGSVYEEKEFIIKLTSSQHIVALYILAYDRTYKYRKRMVNTYVYVGESENCTENPQVAGPFFSSGFFELSEPARGQYVCLKRYDSDVTDGLDFTLYEVRLYQTPNILAYVQSLTGPSSDDSDYPLTNLI